MEKIELLSPAGDLERLKIAFMYGADACYFGGREFSLRANAQNFSLDEIKEATEFAHSLGKRVYVTVNILFHEEDFEGLEDYLDKLYEINVDALIIADPFLIPLLKEKYPNVEIFLSTQNSTTNKEAVKFFIKEGVDRIVLARELNYLDIKEIYNDTKADLEVFLHGAMCSNYSGRCVLSNYFTLRDANRGGCAQVCRFAFDLNKEEDIKFSLAPKDLNLARVIPELIDTGAKSLKIEGRMRSAYYIATVNSSYRKLIDAYYNNSLTDELIEREAYILSRVANRESTEQFFLRDATVSDQYYTNREEISNQDFLGIVLNYDEETKLATIEQRNYFELGDKINVFGPNNINIELVVIEMFDKDMNPLKVARHPKQIIKIKSDNYLPPQSMIRVSFNK